MALKDEDSLITVSGTRVVTGSVEIGSTISPNEWDSYAPCCYPTSDSRWLGLDPQLQYDDWCFPNLWGRVHPLCPIHLDPSSLYSRSSVWNLM